VELNCGILVEKWSSLKMMEPFTVQIKSKIAITKPLVYFINIYAHLYKEHLSEITYPKEADAI
jgi:hypothetical protein